MPMGQDDAISAGSSDKNRFLYQGKEYYGANSNDSPDSWQVKLALNIYDFHARQYDPATGRFTGVDPKADVMPYMGTYAGMMNNPMYFTDPDGECPICPFIIGAVIGAYMGGVAANDGNFNPTDWNYDSQTWGYMIAGGIVGGITGGVGNAVATSGVGAANTKAIVLGSMINSAGTKIYTGGQSDLSIGFGAASFNFDQGEFGYLGKKGNSTLENIGYGFGALENIQDVAALNVGETVNYNSLKHLTGHGSVTNEDLSINISKGYESGSLLFGGEGTKWGTAPRSKLFPPIKINNVNGKILKNMTENIRIEDKGIFGVSRLRYGLIGNTCASQSARALMFSGVLGVNPFTIHPSSLYLQLLVRQAGIQASPFLYNMNY